MMSDLFHMPFEFIDRVFAVMALTKYHTYQILTKRPERMAEYFHLRPGMERAAIIAEVGMEIGNVRWRVDDRLMFGHEEDRRVVDDPGWPLPNVWLGTSVEDQATADERIPHLLRCPAEVRFLSCEPLIGPIDLTVMDDCLYSRRDSNGNCWQGKGGIHWVIVGGESGPGARPFDPQDAYSLMQQCEKAQVPFLMKQMGSKPYDKFNDQPVKILDPRGHDWIGYDDLRKKEYPVSARNCLAQLKRMLQ